MAGMAITDIARMGGEKNPETKVKGEKNETPSLKG